MVDGSIPGLNRRAFLERAGLAAATVTAACSPAAPEPSPSPAGSESASATGWERAWEELVTAAKREGKLALVTTPGTGLRENVEAFEKAFPGISVDHTALIASQFVPRLVPELQAGIYNFDVMTSSYSGTTAPVVEGGHIEPIKPALIRPDVLDEKAWADGFQAGWKDAEQQFIYGGFINKSRYLWINTDMVQEDEIKSVQDLLNPKWKGRILSGDPRNHGYGTSAASAMRLGLKDDTIIKRLWKDQDVTLSRDVRQLAEFMFQGKHPIGIGAMHPPLIPEYFDLGLGKNLKYVEMDHVDTTSGGLSNLYLFKRAPNPNAGRLFINWVLTKEGMSVWSNGAQENGRRVDVSPVAPEYLPAAGRQYLRTDTPDGIREQAKTQELARQALN